MVPTEARQKDNFHCVPACLESILRELGIPKTQDEIVKENPECFHFGKENQGTLLNAASLESVIRHLGIGNKLEVLTDLGGLAQIANVRENIILLFCTKVSNHVVRFLELRQDGKVVVMDPAVGQIRIMDSAEIGSYQPHALYFRSLV